VLPKRITWLIIALAMTGFALCMTVICANACPFPDARIVYDGPVRYWTADEAGAGLPSSGARPNIGTGDTFEATLWLIGYPGETYTLADDALDYYWTGSAYSFRIDTGLLCQREWSGEAMHLEISSVRSSDGATYSVETDLFADGDFPLAGFGITLPVQPDIILEEGTCEAVLAGKVIRFDSGMFITGSNPDYPSLDGPTAYETVTFWRGGTAASPDYSITRGSAFGDGPHATFPSAYLSVAGDGTGSLNLIGLCQIDGWLDLTAYDTDQWGGGSLNLRVEGDDIFGYPAVGSGAGTYGMPYQTTESSFTARWVRGCDSEVDYPQEYFLWGLVVDEDGISPAFSDNLVMLTWRDEEADDVMHWRVNAETYVSYLAPEHPRNPYSYGLYAVTTTGFCIDPPISGPPWDTINIRFINFDGSRFGQIDQLLDPALASGGAYYRDIVLDQAVIPCDDIPQEVWIESITTNAGSVTRCYPDPLNEGYEVRSCYVDGASDPGLELTVGAGSTECFGGSPIQYSFKVEPVDSDFSVPSASDTYTVVCPPSGTYRAVAKGEQTKGSRLSGRINFTLVNGCTP